MHSSIPYAPYVHKEVVFNLNHRVIQWFSAWLWTHASWRL